MSGYIVRTFRGASLSEDTRNHLADIVRTLYGASASEDELRHLTNMRIAQEYIPLEYISLIFSKWLRSLRYGNDFYRLMDPDSFYKSYQMYIARVLALPNAMAYLAVLGDDHDVALGFCVCHGKVLDYVHVHKDHRKQGIGRRLVPTDIERVTHLTRTGLHIWGTKQHGLKFDPFA